MKERKAKKWLDLERGHIIQVFCWQSLHKILMKNGHVWTYFKNVFCCYVYVVLLLFCVVQKWKLSLLFLCTDYTDLTQLDWTVMLWIEMSSQNQLNLNVVQRVAAANSSLLAVTQLNITVYSIGHHCSKHCNHLNAMLTLPFQANQVSGGWYDSSTCMS